MGARKRSIPKRSTQLSRSSKRRPIPPHDIAPAEEIGTACCALKHLACGAAVKVAAWERHHQDWAEHTQDATRWTLAQEFSGCCHSGERNGLERRQSRTLTRWMEWRRAHRGRHRLNAPVGFDKMVAERIAGITGMAFTNRAQKLEALAAHDCDGCFRTRRSTGRRSACHRCTRHRLLGWDPRSGRANWRCRERDRLCHHAGAR